MKLAAAVAELESLDSATEISGRVSTLFFQKETFCTGRLTMKGRDVKFSVKGFVRAGEPITLRGRWVEHAKYGRQFEASEIVYTLPANPEGLALWLQWEGYFIGPAKARKLIDEFGMDLPRLLTEDPQQVAIAAAIPIESIHELAAKWEKHSNRIAAGSQLAAWGLTQHEVDSILARFGGSAVSILTEDPFAILGKVDGLGWKRVDEIAAKLGVIGDDPRRLRGAVHAVVRERYGEGHTATPECVACDLAADKLGGLRGSGLAEKIAATVSEAVEAGRFRRVVDEALGSSWLASGWAWTCETAIWERLAASREANPCVESAGGMDPDPFKFCRDYYGTVSEGVTLDDGQIAAIVNAASHRLSVITGGAGAGKTLVAKQITKFFTDGDVKVMLCAPTGKAARRLTEVIGLTATTIHRLLSWNPRTSRFDFGKEMPLPAGVVLCDEASMIDGELGAALLSACGPDTAIVLIGDPNQLPPVGAGAMLRDILAHDLAPTTRLQQCHRQAGTLKHNCNAILRGIVEPWASDEDPSPWIVSRKVSTAEQLEKLVRDLYAKWLPAWGLNPLADAQLMTAKHAGKWGTTAINRLMQRIHQAALGNELPPPAKGEDGEELEDEKRAKRPVIYTGDKVIQTRNNYGFDVMNGTIGFVASTGPLVVNFDGREVEYPKENEGEIQLAYCLTPHKMQGSEIPCGVVIVPKVHSFMQHRNWFYTAATRAKRTCVIIGDDDGIRRAAERVENNRRQTLLEVWAKHERARPSQP